MTRRASVLALAALLIPGVARAETDADRAERSWREGHVIPPGVYHLDRPVTFDVTGIRVLTLDGVTFDGGAVPADAPWITRFCSAQRLDDVRGAVWVKGAHRVAVEINRNSCLSLRDRPSH